VTFYGEVPKGFAFFRHDGDEFRGIPHGAYCLTANGHGVDYWFTTEPKPCLDEGGDWEGDDSEYMDTVEAIEPAFNGDPQAGWALVECCKQAGWDRAKDALVLYWLVDQMAKLIAAHTGVKP
jgi:hypothetical protein